MVAWSVDAALTPLGIRIGIPQHIPDLRRRPRGAELTVLEEEDDEEIEGPTVGTKDASMLVKR